jgi:hypothetical protein
VDQCHFRSNSAPDSGSLQTDQAASQQIDVIMEGVFCIEQRLVERRSIVVVAMIECNHAEERLARIDRILRQLKRQPVSFKAIAAKVVNVVAYAAPSLDVDKLPPAEPPKTPTLRAGVARVALPARVAQQNDRRVSWRSRRIKLTR